MLLLEHIGENERSDLYFQDKSDAVEGLEVNIVGIMFWTPREVANTGSCRGDATR
jgi:hypothetical protein